MPERTIVSERSLPFAPAGGVCGFRRSAPGSPAGGDRPGHQRGPRIRPAPRGAWRIVMRAAAGMEYPNESEFLEVTPPSRIVFVHLRPHAPVSWMTMTFAPEGAGTRLSWHMQFRDRRGSGSHRHFHRAGQPTEFRPPDRRLVRNEPPGSLNN
ncbi:MAG: SRPBCC domain-containing protein [Lacunisphaera sp.]